LQRFAGEPLRNQVYALVDKEYGIQVAQPMTPSHHVAGNPRPASTQATQTQYQPTSPSEINPDLANNPTRSKEFVTKKHFKSSECPICLEDFTASKKRVNLFCGHSICPNCLFGQMYMRNDHSCPTCRQTIRKEEFSVNYMQPHVNTHTLKEQFPGFENLQKIQRFFPWA
jgi:hypothetical protein